MWSRWGPHTLPGNANPTKEEPRMSWGAGAAVFFAFCLWVGLRRFQDQSWPTGALPVSKEAQEAKEDAKEPDASEEKGATAEPDVPSSSTEAHPPGAPEVPEGAAVPSGVETPLRVRLLRMMVVVGAGLVSLVYLANIPQLVGSPWSAARLSLTASVWHGYKLYYPLTEGPVLSMIYNPLACLVWLPAMWLPTVTTQIIAAGCLTLLVALGPVFFMCLSGSSKQPLRRLIGLAMALAAAALLVSLKSTRYITTYVHVDGVCVGFALLSCVVLMRTKKAPSWRTYVLAALLVNMAMWSKQTAAPIFAAQCFFLWLGWGTKEALRYLAIGLAWVGLFFVLLVLGLSHDVGAFFLNILLIPSKHPYKYGLYGVFLFALLLLHKKSIMLLLVAWWVSVAPTSYRSWQRQKEWVQENTWLLLPIVVVATLPLSVMGFCKVGGDVNHFHSMYFLIAWVALMGARVEWSYVVETTRQDVSSRLLYVVASAICLMPLTNVFLLDKLAVVHKNQHEEVVRFLKAHPGEAYFPWYPLSSLHVEKKAYHLPYGLYDRMLAGYNIPQQTLRSGIPHKMKYLILRPGDKRFYKMRKQVFPGQKAPYFILHFFPGFRYRVSLPDAPRDWLVLTRKRN